MSKSDTNDQKEVLSGERENKRPTKVEEKSTMDSTIDLFLSQIKNLDYSSMWRNTANLIKYIKNSRGYSDVSDVEKDEIIRIILQIAREKSREVTINSNSYGTYLPALKQYIEGTDKVEFFPFFVTTTLVDMQKIAFNNPEMSNEDRQRVHEDTIKFLNSISAMPEDMRETTKRRLEDIYTSTKVATSFKAGMKVPVQRMHPLQRRGLTLPEKCIYLNTDISNGLKLPDYEAYRSREVKPTSIMEFYDTSEKPLLVKGYPFTHHYLSRCPTQRIQWIMDVYKSQTMLLQGNINADELYRLVKAGDGVISENSEFNSPQFLAAFERNLSIRDSSRCYYNEETRT